MLGKTSTVAAVERPRGVEDSRAAPDSETRCSRFIVVSVAETDRTCRVTPAAVAYCLGSRRTGRQEHTAELRLPPRHPAVAPGVVEARADVHVEPEPVRRVERVLKRVGVLWTLVNSSTVRTKRPRDLHAVDRPEEHQRLLRVGAGAAVRRVVHHQRGGPRRLAASTRSSELSTISRRTGVEVEGGADAEDGGAEPGDAVSQRLVLSPQVVGAGHTTGCSVSSTSRAIA